MKGKKGQGMSNLPGIILVVVFSLLLIGIGLVVIQSMFNIDSLTDDTKTITNETIRLNSSNLDTLESVTYPGFNSVTVLNLNNGTGVGETLNIGNVSVSSQGVVSNTSEFTSDNINITYSFKYGGASYLGVNSTLESFSQIPGFMGLLILVIMIGIIVAVLLGVGKKTGVGA